MALVQLSGPSVPPYSGSKSRGWRFLRNQARLAAAAWPRRPVPPTSSRIKPPWSAQLAAHRQFSMAYFGFLSTQWRTNPDVNQAAWATAATVRSPWRGWNGKTAPINAHRLYMEDNKAWNFFPLTGAFSPLEFAPVVTDPGTVLPAINYSNFRRVTQAGSTFAFQVDVPPPLVFSAYRAVLLIGYPNRRVRSRNNPALLNAGLQERQSGPPLFLPIVYTFDFSLSWLYGGIPAARYITFGIRPWNPLDSCFTDQVLFATAEL